MTTNPRHSRPDPLTSGTGGTGQACAVPGCSVEILPGRLMCFDHWTRLPHKVRVRVNMAYSVDRGSAEHRAAIAEAVQLVLDQLAREAAAVRLRQEEQ